MPPPPPVSWRIHREIVLLAGWGRAILLQLAHPLVAQGVADHTRFDRGARDSFARLRRTVEAMLAMTFGPPDLSERAARTINGIHDRVHGRLAEAAGRFPRGHPYSARDPELLTWVHATLVESQLLTYRLLVGPLSAAEGDRYCLETSGIEAALGIPGGRVPRSEGELAAYLAAMLGSGEIEVTGTARRLGAAVLEPPLPWPFGRAIGSAGRLVTAGLLPATVRQAYGLGWSPARARAFTAVTRAARLALPLVPGPLRHWSRARRVSAC